MRARFQLFHAWLCLALWPAAAAVGQPAPAANTDAALRIKAAYVFNFIKFAEWPEGTFASSATPLVVGVVDEGGAAAAVIAESVAGKTLRDGRVVSVQRFESFEAAVQASQLVFVGAAVQLRPGQLHDAGLRHAVLIVGESDGFAAAGGTLNLLVVGDAVRCELNLAGAERAGVRLSPRLASVAQLVRETNAGR